MKKYLFCMAVGFAIGSLMFLVISCKNKCKNETEMIKFGIEIFGDILDCSNPIALESYIRNQMKELKLCHPDNIASKDNPTKICKKIIGNILNNGINSLPKDADCFGGVVSDVTESDYIEFCEEYFK